MVGKGKIFVLVHGAYHGAWCWKKITGLLALAGATVFTPTLTGLGEKKNLISTAVGLSTHINDIVYFLNDNGLFDVFLVGHSYSGFVISGVAEAVPDRIECLVYLDSFVPQDGQKVFDIRPSLREKGEFINIDGNEVKVLMPPEPQVLGITSGDDIILAKSLFTPMPYACYNEPISLGNDRARKIRKVYLFNEIQVPGESQKSHEVPYKNAHGDNWSREIIPGPHDSMITHPKELAAVLLRIAD